jgi:hypothetical protein
MSDQQYTYTVDGHDHFDPPGEDAYYRIGTFDRCQDAIAAAQAVIDQSLQLGYDHSLRDNRPVTAQQLLDSWRAAGHGAGVYTSDPDCSFDENAYASRRCHELCRNEDGG